MKFLNKKDLANNQIDKVKEISVNERILINGHTALHEGNFDPLNYPEFVGPSGPQGIQGNTGPTGPAGPVNLQSAGDNTTGALRYAGIAKTDGQLYGGTLNPTENTRLNYNGNLYATKFIGEIDGGEF